MSKKQTIKDKIMKNAKSKLVDNNFEQSIFNKEIISFKVSISFCDMDEFVESTLKSYAKKNIMGKCHKEGFISKSYCNIVKYTSGKMTKDSIMFDVDYEFLVCYPYENMELMCTVQNITKIGIKAIVKSKNEVPIIVFASRVHNEHVFSQESVEEDDESDITNNFKEGDNIKINVLGYRFEINDPHISTLGKIVSKTN
jgi:DNA-directed RNA polymerase subunit E'/Rpb7